MSRKFAVFDIDGTIVRTALFIQIVDELLAAGKLKPELREAIDTKWEAYRTRAHQGAFIDYNQTVVDTLFDNLSSLAVADYHAAVDRVIERSRSQIYVYTRDLIKSLRGQGYFLIALSGSEMYAIEQFTSHYGFDFVAGDTYREKDGMFSGEIDNSIFHDKGTALKKIVEAQGLSYKDSVAIGDSLGDARMLELVEHPIAFNPEAQLFTLAREKHWKIVVERKNVVYELEPTDGTYLLAETD